LGGSSLIYKRSTAKTFLPKNFMIAVFAATWFTMIIFAFLFAWMGVALFAMLRREFQHDSFQKSSTTVKVQVERY
jgi:uncharacterized membrane protein